MSSQPLPRTWYVRDCDSAVFTCTVQDEEGTPIPGSALDSLTMWLYLNAGEKPIINSRDGVDVLSSLDESGNFELVLTPEDNEFQGLTGGTEIHVLVLRWEFNTNRAGSHEAWIQVTDQPKVSVP